MRFRLLILTVFLSSFFFPYAQSTAAQYDALLKSVQGFRYSLYAEVEKVGGDYNTFLFKAQDSTSSFYKKCRQFYLEHALEIRAYQQYLLEQHAAQMIDTSWFVADPSYNKVLGQPFAMQEAFGNTYMYRTLIALDPIAHAAAVIQMSVISTQEVTEVGRRSFLTTLGQPSVKTIQLNDDNRQLVWDEYKHVFVLSYQPSRQQMVLLRALKRK